MIYTQKQLESKTNKEINKIICDLIEFEQAELQRSIINAIEQLNRDQGFNNCVDYYGHDYCNSHNYIMPLVHKDKIWLSYSSSARATASKWHNGEMIRVEHDNPLRAFAIAWVLINQGAA